jgi:hypothetical protein
MPVRSPSGYRSKSKTRFGRSKVLESVQPSYANTKIAIRVLSTQLDLLCYECRINIASKSNFRFERYDILSSPKERFNVIRATKRWHLQKMCRLEKIEVSGSGSQIDELIRQATDVQTAQNTSCDLPA